MKANMVAAPLVAAALGFSMFPILAHAEDAGFVDDVAVSPAPEPQIIDDDLAATAPDIASQPGESGTFGAEAPTVASQPAVPEEPATAEVFVADGTTLLSGAPNAASEPQQERLKSSDKKRDEKISQFKKKYAKSPTGGIALCGTSYVSRWSAAKTFDKIGYDPKKVYNFGIGGDSPKSMGSDAAYIGLVASKRPSVIMFNGINDLNDDVIKKTSKAKKSDARAVRESVGAVKTFVENTRAAIAANGGKPAKFVLVGSLKTPARYRESLSPSRYNSNKGPKSCRMWERVAQYNDELRKYAASQPDVSYYDLGKHFYYKTANGLTRFYSNSKMKKGNYFRAVKMIAGKQTNPYLSKDLNHPSSKAYSEMFPYLAKALVKAGK